MQLTQKIEIFPTIEQESVLWTLSNQCRLLYNFALKERLDDKKITYITQQNKLPDLKKKYPVYTQVYAKVLQITLKTLDANFKSYKALSKVDSRANPPRYRGYKYFFTLKYNQSGYKVQNGFVYLSHKVNEIKLQFKIPSKFCFECIKQVEIYQTQTDSKYYMSIIYQYNEPEYVDNGLYQAIDLGITKQTLVNSNGKFLDINNVRPDLYWKKPISELQARRDHCRKGSKKWKKLNALKRKCEINQLNQSKDWQHKSSKKIIDNTKANTIIIGDLNVKQMTESKQTTRGLNRSTQNTGALARFSGFLTYKAQKAGKKVIRISEYQTSKLCCVCGQMHDMKLSNRVMKCDCGNELDRDRNSAINIMVRYLSQNAMWTGYQQFADNLRKTGVSIETTLVGSPLLKNSLEF
jgi:putative transposase